MVRLNTYLRRYLSPLVTRDLFRLNQLPILLKRHEIETITALVLDMRGFVRTTESSERTDEGLDAVARLLQTFFSRIIRIAFENYGLVGEFAGDRVLIVFGFPPPSVLGYAETQTDNLAINVQRAVSTVFGIQREIEGIKSNESFSESLRQFEIGIGVCARGPAWVGDIGGDHLLANEDSWRQELTFISSAVNIAARAEEITKNEKLMEFAPRRRIIVDKIVVEQMQSLIGEDRYNLRDLGETDVRGLHEKVHLYHLTDVQPDALLPGERIEEVDRLLVDWICEHIDGTIERDVFNKVRRSLADVGQIIVAGAVPNEEAVFNQIMTQIIDSLKAEKATLYRVDLPAGILVAVNSVGPRPLPAGFQIPLGQGIAGQVGEKGEPFISFDVHNDETWAGRKASQFDPSIHSMLCVPLKAGDQITGVIQVMDNESGKFRQSDLETLETFAGLAAVALKNAQTYEQERRVSRARLIITEAFSSARTLDEVLEAVMLAIKDTLQATNATIYSLDPETGELIFEKVLSDSQNPPPAGSRLPAGKGIASWVVTNREPILITDARTDNRWFGDVGKIGSDIRSMICAPLLAKGQTVGAIQVLDRRHDFFNQEHLEILEWLSASAAVAVDNAAQVDQARRKLIASDTVAGMSAIAAKLAHNLKNYVTGIQFIAKNQLKFEDEKSQQRVQAIVKAADAALAEVVEFTRPIQELKPANIDVDAALRELLVEVGEVLKDRQKSEAELTRKELEKPKIIVEYQPFGEPLIVYTVKDQIKYIFRNLVDNAIRAIDEKGEATGKITLKTSLEEVYETGWVIVTVQDTGIGIPPANLGRIFNPSFTTRPEGTVGGFGLFWVQLNVERMGGRITVNSEVGVGTTFQVRLRRQPL